jgi:hypothetical protein
MRASKLSGMRGIRLSLVVITSIAVGALSGCSLVPDLAPESLAANKVACDTVSTVWNDLSSVVESGDLVNSATALENLPQQLQAAIESSTDASLDDALTVLNSAISELASGASLDISKLAQSGAALAARCAVFGVTPDLTLPGM